MSNLVDAGKITSVYGIKGWVKVLSQTDPPENLFHYQPWQLKTKHGVKPIEVKEWRPHGKNHIALLEGIEDRDQAEALCPLTIAIDKAALPALSEDEYYWHQLNGCRVVTAHEENSLDLGVVKSILPTGANDVLVVVGDVHSIDTKERLVPYAPGQFVKKIDIENEVIWVDWDPEF